MQPVFGSQSAQLWAKIAFDQAEIGKSAGTTADIDRAQGTSPVVNILKQVAVNGAQVCQVEVAGHRLPRLSITSMAR